MALTIGSIAPDFKLPSTSGEDFVLSENLPCILFFYPRDFTPGCTKEVCEFRDEFSEFRNLDIQVFGISKDSIPSHQKFIKKNNLPFDLISDQKMVAIEKYDAKVPFIGIPKRVTYLIDKEGIIQASYDNLLGAEKHISKMIKNLKN